ncbi:MAG: nucleotidyltransferase domain-containing protein [Desulfobacteraceae bacterium]
MDKEEAIRKLKVYKKLLSKHLRFDELILFGSYAGGTQNDESDIDVAIVLEETNGDFFSTRPIPWKVSRGVDDRIEPVILERKHDDSGFLEEVIKTGIKI